jgi:hypothetical protein
MVRVYRCPWRDALDNFDPQNHARHVAEFFRIADAVIDDETQYLCGPETLILEQIDEEDPSGSIYKHLDFYGVPGANRPREPMARPLASSSMISPHRPAQVIT